MFMCVCFVRKKPGDKGGVTRPKGEGGGERGVWSWNGNDGCRWTLDMKEDEDEIRCWRLF